jgi:hypothetical protein
LGFGWENLQSISTPIEKTTVLFGEESQGDQAGKKTDGQD